MASPPTVPFGDRRACGPQEPVRARCVVLPGRTSSEGPAAASLILAGGGNDTVYGRGGPDALVGGSGHDRLYGGAGDDVLNAWDRTRDVLSRRARGKDTAFADRVDQVTSVEHLHRRR